ncbi:MAG TPA: sensor domain-containing diguanylate cyclase [Parasulfuritortus sp.]
MRIASEKYRLLGWLSLILIVGFLSTSIAAYVVSSDSIRKSIANDALPLTSDNIYSEIQKDLLRPVFISSLMANDTFLRDWVLNGEKDVSQVTRYLAEVREKYGTISSFLVSEKTRRYYYAKGILKTVSPSVAADAWYFRVRRMTAPYEINVDYDLANHNSLTIFINHRVFDYQGHFIGAAGVGLTLGTVSQLIDRYEERFRRRIFFVAPTGRVVLTGKSMMQVHGSIRDLPGIRGVADRILNGKQAPTSLEYRQDGAEVLVNSRFIPELGWYLVVEQDGNSEIAPIKRTFLANLAVSLAASLLVLAVTLFAVNRYQRRLEHIATRDPLTGLLNRQAFEFVFQQLIAEAKRAGRPLSAVLFDIDLFKQVNDRYGHLEGDKVIREVAELARGACRASDVVVRWGGEEFMLILNDCRLDQAQAIAEKLRLAVAGHDFPLSAEHGPITISLGAVQLEPGESETSLFGRADRAMYLAKERGRNQVAASHDQTGPAA